MKSNPSCDEFEVAAFPSIEPWFRTRLLRNATTTNNRSTQKKTRIASTAFTTTLAMMVRAFARFWHR